MTKHTPGPWKYEPSTKTIRSMPSNYWLATLDSFDGAINNEANAKLISAAPDLLSACKKLMEWWDRNAVEFCRLHIDYRRSNVGQDLPVMEIGKAIAKAEGGTT